MKNKFINLMIILFLSFGLLFALTSCGDDNPTTNIEEEKYKIILPTVDNGSISSSATTVKKGESVELTVTPNENYKLDYLKANDVELTVANNKATINDIQKDQIISAAFSGVDVVVTFVADGATVDTKTLKYGLPYGSLPTPDSDKGVEFVGWYTEENGAGELVDEKTLVNNGKSHFLYAYYTVSKLNVSVNGLVDRLVHLPGEESQTALLEVTVLDDIIDVTNNVNITVESSDSSVLVVEGLTLKIADNADGVATIKIFVDDVEYEKFDVTAIDYDGLGFEVVSTKEEFLAMQGTKKYVLINDIKIDGWLAKADYTPLINKLEEVAVIDGNGHFVAGGKLPGGWNRCWISEVYGTVRNIAFTNLRNADSNAFSTGLFGFLKPGGVLENIYVDANIVADGSIDAANKSGGVLIGTLEGGTIKDVILNVNVKKGVKVEAYGAFAAIITASDAKVYNSYALINHTYLREFGNEYKYGSWLNAIQDDSGEAINSVFTLLNIVEKENLFNSIWKFTESSVSFGEKEILELEPKLSGVVEEEIIFASDEANPKVDFIVYNYGEETLDYTVTNYKSSDESIFSVDSEGNITIKKDGVATLTITIDGELTLETTVRIKPDYYLITTLEEFRTLLAADPAGKFKLGNNIDFKGEFFAKTDATALVATFSGEFDGQGYAIYNAKLPGGWNGHSLFNVNTGTIKNVAFINTLNSPVCTNTGIIGDNKGLIENVYVDFVVATDGREYGFSGVVAGYSGIGVMKNCITNIRLSDGLSVAPAFQGSIVGNANAWLGVMSNCYSIVHNTGVVNIASTEGANGIIKQFNNQGSKQFQTYTQLKTFADVSMYDKNIWTFDEDKIVFGHNVVYTLQEDDSYQYISTAEEFLTEIQKNPAGKFRIAADIDFKGQAITFKENNIEFSGVIDGMGHIISNAVMEQDNIFAKNSGEILNLAFVNLNGPSQFDFVGLVNENVGLIDNLFIDYVINHDGSEYQFGGVVAANASTGTISSTIVNLRLGEGVTTVPELYGSLVGMLHKNSKITNSYAITNSINISDIAVIEIENGLINALKVKSCNQFVNYSDITKSGEEYLTFNKKYWSFNNAQIKFSGTVVLLDTTQDDYTYISTVEEWKTLITADPTGKFKLKNDIDFKGDWITKKDASVLADKFTGILDGQGYKIMNAKMPGGWAGHSLFNYNEGEIRNIAFINLQASPVVSQTSLFNINRGIIENIYVDYVLKTATYTSNYNGVIATFADNQLSKTKPSEIRNCIVNVRLGDGQVLPPSMGSIVGKAGGWTGYVKNCYAIINNTGIENVYFDPNGTVAEATCKTSAQFETYQLLKAGADFSMYDSEIWSFTDTSISFFGREVYSVNE